MAGAKRTRKIAFSERSDNRRLLNALRRWLELDDRQSRLPDFVKKWGVRETALRVLSCAVKSREADLFETALAAIYRIYGNRMPAREVIIAISDTILTALRAPEREIREVAIDNLDEAEISGRDKADILFRFLLDPRKNVRQAASWGLDRLGQRVVPRILSALREPRYQRREAVWNMLMALDTLLDHMRPARKRETAEAILNTLPLIRQEWSLWKAVDTLACQIHVGGEIGARCLAEAIVRHPGEIRRLCASEFAYHGEPGIARRHLGPLTSHPTAGVRKAAKLVLQALDHRARRASLQR